MTGKLNIADQMTLAYNEIHAGNDAGEKLLKLDALKKDIDKISIAPKFNNKLTVKEGVGLIGGVVAGLAMPIWGTVTLDEIYPAITDGMIAVGGTFSAVAGAVGGGIGAAKLINWREARKTDNKKISYIKDVVPCLQNLEVLTQKIDKDIDNYVYGEKAQEVLSSTQLKKVLRVYPDIMKQFNKSSGLAPQSVVAVDPDNPQISPQNDKTLSL